MSDQFIPKIERADVGRSGDASGLSRKRFKLGPITIALLIFMLAFALRAGHNIGLRHQVWLLGDAYNYLFTGNLLLRTVQEPGKLQELISKGGNSSKALPDHLKLASRDLSDRISLDGLLYPSYLALAQSVAGVGRSTTMEESRLPVCLCNSFVDSVSSVLVFLAATVVFGSTVGIAAGILSAAYPPFVIGTQQCLSEPLACFFISLWLLALLRVVKLTGTSIRSDIVSCSFLGIATAFVVMSKPTHALLPLSALMMSAGFLCGRVVLSKKQKGTEFNQQDFRPVRFAGLSVISIVSAAIILIPSMLVTKTITGQWMVAAKRSPFESLALTFNASQDGWYAYPYPGTVPNSTAEVLELAKKAISETNASELLLIGIKKIARLWTGVANDYQFSVLGVGYDMQVFLHRLMLVFAFVGLLILLIRSKSVFSSRRALCGAMLFLAISFHSIYLLFEALPRYGLTAMPAVIILAAYGLVSAYRSAISPAYFFAPASILSASLFFLQASRDQCVAIAGILGSDLGYLAPWISGLLQSLVVLGIFQICVSLLVIGPATLRSVVTVPNSSVRSGTTPLVRWSCLAATITISLVIVVCSVDRRDWSEWRCELKPDQSVKQTISMSQVRQRPNNALLLIDCASSALPPAIRATVNGSEIAEELIPFAQIANGPSSILDGLMRAESVMGKDSRSFRQWWAVPLPVRLLKYGSDNDVVLRTDAPDGVTIFGDFRHSDRAARLALIPSLWRFSYTKGYCSIERGDPRVMEEVALQCDKVKSSFYKDGNWSSNDLSSAWGAQSGEYRVRILTVGSADSNQADEDSKPVNESISLITGRPFEIDGKNPKTMFPLEHQIKLPPNLSQGSRFELTCEVRSISATSDAVVSLVFGNDPGWSSQWQPKSIPIDGKWKRVSFSDTLPASVTADSEVRLVVYPYQSDLIYTNRKEALSSRVEIREVSLKLVHATVTGLFQQSSQAQLY